LHHAAVALQLQGVLTLRYGYAAGNGQGEDGNADGARVVHGAMVGETVSRCQTAVGHPTGPRLAA
jgi:hypothetical protein